MVTTFITIGVVLGVTKGIKGIKVIKETKAIKGIKGSKAIKETKDIKGLVVVKLSSVEHMLKAPTKSAFLRLS